MILDAESIHVTAVLAMALITGFAGLVHGAIGLGFPLIATPLLALMTDVRMAILLLLLPTAVINLANVLHGRHWEDSLGRYWPLAIYGAVGSVIGTRMLIVMDPEPFRLVMAVVLIVYLNAERLGIGMGWVHRYPQAAFAVFGLAAGILAGTVNVMLPALIILALEIRMPKTVMIQVFNFCFLVGKLTQGGVFLHAGLLDRQIWAASLLLAAWSLGIMLWAMRLRDRIDQDTYRRWLRRLLAVLAIMLTWQYFR
jgi:uncharacterized membrane protein YfcA